MTARQYLESNHLELMQNALAKAREQQKIVSFKTVEEKYSGETTLGYHRFRWFFHPDGKISFRRKSHRRRPWGKIYRETNLEKKGGSLT